MSDHSLEDMTTFVMDHMFEDCLLEIRQDFDVNRPAMTEQEIDAVREEAVAKLNGEAGRELADIVSVRLRETLEEIVDEMR